MSSVKFTEQELKLMLNTIKTQINQHGAGSDINNENLASLPYEEKLVIDKMKQKYGDEDL